MSRVSKVLPHLSVEEVTQKIKTATSFRRQQKWLMVYNALVDPREAAQIALHTGTTKRTVHQVISDYNRLGVKGIETPGKGGRRRGYMSLAEEKKFLNQFLDSAQKGMKGRRQEAGGRRSNLMGIQPQQIVDTVETVGF